MLTCTMYLKPSSSGLGPNATSQHLDLGFRAVTPPGILTPDRAPGLGAVCEEVIQVADVRCILPTMEVNVQEYVE